MLKISISSCWVDYDYSPGGMIRHIEQAGKTCYQSGDSSKLEPEDFVKMICKKNHGTVLEHGYLIFEVSEEFLGNFFSDYNHSKKYFQYSWIEDRALISGTIRSFRESLKFEKIDKQEKIYERELIRIAILNGYEVFFKDLEIDLEDSLEGFDGIRQITPRDLTGEEIEMHMRLTARIIANRGVSHEWVRHDEMGISQESSRYCDYTKERFGNDIRFIDDIGALLDIKDLTEEDIGHIIGELDRAYQNAERSYKLLRGMKVPAQIARNVLPIGIKTEFVASDTVENWKHFFDQRSPQAKAAHPQMREATEVLFEAFQRSFSYLYP